MAASLVLAACLPQARSEGGDDVEGPVEAKGPRCKASSAATLALLERAGCALALELEGETLVLRDLDESAIGPIARGEGPSACGPELELCQVDGLVDAELGPLLVLAQRGPESEMPVQVFVGWVDKGRLGFAETWYGLPSVVDHTRVGPPWALAPHSCGGTLELLPTPRLPEASGEAPDDALLGLAGAWTVAEDGSARAPESGGASTAGSCRLALPALP